MKIAPPTPGIGAPAPETKLSQADQAKLKKISKDFEGVFLNQMVSAMRKTAPRNGYIKESYGEQVFQGMLDQEYANKIADSEELGLSKLIYEQLLRTAEGR